MVDESLNALEIEELYERESARNFSSSVGFFWSVSDLNYYLNYLKNMKKVKFQDMQNYFDKYIKNENYVAGILISKSDQKKYGINERILQW